MSEELLKIKAGLKGYNPQKVILFGSHAWGKPHKNSDIDLLVIKNTRAGFFERIPKARSYLLNIESPLDILVLTPQEVKNKIHSGDLFISEIMDKGRIIYEK